MNIDTHITLDRLLIFAFCLVVVGIATALTLGKQVTGAEWCNFTVWIVGVVALGRAVGDAATGYVQNAQTRATEAATRAQVAAR